jgi:hypothetical protein
MEVSVQIVTAIDQMGPGCTVEECAMPNYYIVYECQRIIRQCSGIQEENNLHCYH